jgi:hypothetical protein
MIREDEEISTRQVLGLDIKRSIGLMGVIMQRTVSWIQHHPNEGESLRATNHTPFSPSFFYILIPSLALHKGGCCTRHPSFQEKMPSLLLLRICSSLSNHLCLSFFPTHALSLSPSLPLSLSPSLPPSLSLSLSLSLSNAHTRSAAPSSPQPSLSRAPSFMLCLHVSQK